MANTHVALIESIARLGVALVRGCVIGFERQWHQKMAGLRTNALVALGSCGFVVILSMVCEGDPTRIAAQVVIGSGFLGAGCQPRCKTDRLPTSKMNQGRTLVFG